MAKKKKTKLAGGGLPGNIPQHDKVDTKDVDYGDYLTPEEEKLKILEILKGGGKKLKKGKLEEMLKMMKGSSLFAKGGD